MPRATRATVIALNLIGWPFRATLRQRGFTPPRRALILQPCCISQVLLATPLLAALADTYPEARFDWAVGDWARPVIASNPRLTYLIPAGRVGLPDCSWQELVEFSRMLRTHQYDTVFIPSRATTLSFVAWQAGIPQRIGLDSQGRGLFHTIGVKPDSQAHTAEQYLGLADALAIETKIQGTEFYPRDSDRNAILGRLMDEIGWQSDQVLAILHPGGGQNPRIANQEKRWPIERFARIGNYLIRQHNAQVLLVGNDEDFDTATAVLGIMPQKGLNLAGRVTLGELGALCEFADLYVGGDTGATHIAAAVGCPTISIYGVDPPSRRHPFPASPRVQTLWQPFKGTFSWDKGVSTEMVIDAVDQLLDN